MTAATDRLRATVDRLLTAYGEPMAFTRTFEGTYDPTTASADTPQTAAYSGVGYPWPYTAYEKLSSLIQENDARLIVNKMTSNPIVGDQVTFRDFSYRVINVNQISMSAQELAFQLQVRI